MRTAVAPMTSLPVVLTANENPAFTFRIRRQPPPSISSINDQNRQALALFVASLSSIHSPFTDNSPFDICIALDCRLQTAYCVLPQWTRPHWSVRRNALDLPKFASLWIFYPRRQQSDCTPIFLEIHDRTHKLDYAGEQNVDSYSHQPASPAIRPCHSV